MVTPVAGVIASPSLAFRVLNPASGRSFSPRLGAVSLSRNSELSSKSSWELPTPGFLTLTSRGIIPHLSWDHVCKTSAIKWVHVPFESFLEHTPPVPTLVPGMDPLHKFLGFQKERQAISVSLRDPNDMQPVRPNGKDYVSAICVRGVRQVTPSAYHTYLKALKPDIIFALSDILIVQQPPSEKRVVKSLERSLRWLAQLLRATISETSEVSRLPNIFVHMVGGIDDVSRDDFATGLLEQLEGADARDLRPLGLETLDEGVSGYSFDLLPLKQELHLAQSQTSVPDPDDTRALLNLIRVSLLPLPEDKPRLVTGTGSPHQILRLVQIGIDVFDSHFAQQAADWGVALDFCFPVPISTIATNHVKIDQREIGINLYDELYSLDFARLAENFLGRHEDALAANGRVHKICPCIACSPRMPSPPLVHSSLEASNRTPSSYAPPSSRAYLNHLLHTHEMSAHALLAAHNLSILAAFFDSIRAVLLEQDSDSKFEQHIKCFHEYYRLPDGESGLLVQAKKQWEKVSLARGKGRLARERAEKEREAMELVRDQGGLI